MKLQIKIGSKIIAELEADSQRSMFEEISKAQDIFGQDTCGKCGKTNVRFVVRNDKDENKYYSMDCLDCRARLSFGCNKKGETLFVKKKDKDEKWISHNGWQKWNSETQSLE